MPRLREEADFLSIGDAGRLLGVSPTQVDVAIRFGELADSGVTDYYPPTGRRRARRSESRAALAAWATRAKPPL